MSTVSVFLLLLAPFLLHHNLTSYYLTFRYRAQALFNSSKQGNVTVALYISGFLIKLRPNFSWEAQCSLELPVCACTPTGPSRTANLHEKDWARHCIGHFQVFACIQSNMAEERWLSSNTVEDSRVALSAFPKICKTPNFGEFVVPVLIRNSCWKILWWVIYHIIT